MKDYISVCADVHLTDKVPRCRSESVDEWYDKQLNFIKMFSNEPVPIVAGDLFDNATGNSDRLLSSVISTLNKPLIAIAGNHDIPLRNHNLIKYSSFGILSKIGLIKQDYIDSVEMIDWCDDVVFMNRLKEIKPETKIIIIHKFIYTQEKWLSRVHESGYVINLLKHVPEHVKLIICGDNHSKFIYEQGERTILNCGSVHRTKANQIDHKPAFYRIYSDLSIKEVPIDCSSDSISREYIELKKQMETKFNDVMNKAKECELKVTSFSKNLEIMVENKSCKNYIISKLEEVNGCGY